MFDCKPTPCHGHPHNTMVNIQLEAYACILLKCQSHCGDFLASCPDVKKEEENREAARIFKINNFVPASK